MGSPAPDFALRTIDGESVSLADLLELHRPLLLVFSDAQCETCRALAPDLARWQREEAHRITVAVIASGGAGANRRHARESGLGRVLLQFDGEIRARYEAAATPSAVLIAADGTVSSPIAAGPDAIRGMVDRAVDAGAPRTEPSRLDDFAKALAVPLRRRRALGILGAAFAALALPALRPRRAEAAHNDICPFNAPTDCVCSPESANCRQSTCPPGYRCCWQPCTDPNGCTCPSTYCCSMCDPDASQCGSGTGPDCDPGQIPVECCGPDSGLCGDGCCPLDQDCCDGTCCPPDATCIDGECREGEFCTGSGNRIVRVEVGNDSFDTSRPLRQGERLVGGQLGTTYEMEDGSRYRIAPGGSLRIGDDCLGPTEFEDVVGKIWVNVKRTITGSDQKFKITNHNTLTGVRGTTFSFEYEPARKRTTVKVTSGAVELRGRNGVRGKVIVRKGETGIQQGRKPPRLID